MSKNLFYFFLLFVILSIAVYKLFNYNEMNTKYIYVIEDNPSFIVLNSSKVKDFEEVLKESEDIDKIIFIKKYLIIYSYNFKFIFLTNNNRYTLM